jgi:hypothetical protein
MNRMAVRRSLPHISSFTILDVKDRLATGFPEVLNL